MKYLQEDLKTSKNNSWRQQEKIFGEKEFHHLKFYFGLDGFVYPKATFLLQFKEKKFFY